MRRCRRRARRRWGTTRETPILADTTLFRSDVDGDAVSYALGSTNTTHGTVTVHANGTFDYAPAQDFNGTDSFSFVVSDGHGGSNEYTFDLTVDPVNDAQVSAPGSATMGDDTGNADLGRHDALPV